MNERIKQLAIDSHPPYGNFDHEKFAQLIINDILQIVNNPVNYNKYVYTTYDKDQATGVAHAISDKIKEYFKDTQ
jgi:hypothetical protein